MKLIKRVIISENIIKYHNIDGNIAFLTDCDINKKVVWRACLTVEKEWLMKIYVDCPAFSIY